MNKSTIRIAAIGGVILLGLFGIKLPAQVADIARSQFGIDIPEAMVRGGELTDDREVATSPSPTSSASSGKTSSPASSRFAANDTTASAGNGNQSFKTRPGAKIYDDFREAKRALYAVYDEHSDTLYCGCSYDNSRRKIDTSSCGYRIKEDRTRGNRIEAEHVIPASWIGQSRQCWRDSNCKDSRGRSLSGRSCCEATDAEFRTAHNDLHNLVPTVGELNKHRGSAPFGEVRGEQRHYGRCDFEVQNRRLVEPRPEVRGDIARIAFYMADQYGVDIRKRQMQTFKQWDKQDPVDEWERERNKRIAFVQGNANPYVK